MTQNKKREAQYEHQKIRRWALTQLWLFWVAPLIGGALGGVVYRWLSEEPGGVVAGK